MIAKPWDEADAVTRPCEVCAVPTTVPAVMVPGYVGPWHCYWCHSVKAGKDPKDVLNLMATSIKFMSLDDGGGSS